MKLYSTYYCNSLVLWCLVLLQIAQAEGITLSALRGSTAETFSETPSLNGKSSSIGTFSELSSDIIVISSDFNIYSSRPEKTLTAIPFKTISSNDLTPQVPIFHSEFSSKFSNLLFTSRNSNDLLPNRKQVRLLNGIQSQEDTLLDGTKTLDIDFIQPTFLAKNSSSGVIFDETPIYYTPVLSFYDATKMYTASSLTALDSISKQIKFISPSADFDDSHIGASSRSVPSKEDFFSSFHYDFHTFSNVQPTKAHAQTSSNLEFHTPLISILIDSSRSHHDYSTFSQLKFHTPLESTKESIHHTNSYYSYLSFHTPLMSLYTSLSQLNIHTLSEPSKASVRHTENISSYLNFHTPLISLLVESPSAHVQQEVSFSINYSSTPNKTNDNESQYSATTNLPTVPLAAPTTEAAHKKLLMLVLRAEDCTKLSKVDFERMLNKLMAKFGFGDAVPEISNARCYPHLNINLTLGNPESMLRFLPNIKGRSNITLDVLNRTFRIVKLEKVDLRYEKVASSNASSHIIGKVAKHESVTYIVVGISCGLIIVICVTVCCIKCWCLNSKDLSTKCSRLKQDDYTLTPIPRCDYYRGDIYSTASVISTPSVETGAVQSFDTSIIPLEEDSVLVDSTFRSSKECSSSCAKSSRGLSNPTFTRY